MSDKTKGQAAATTKATNPSTSVVLDICQPKKGSVRLKTKEKNPIVSDLYLMRGNALVGRNIPAGHVPTSVRVTVEVLETKPEADLPTDAA